MTVSYDQNMLIADDGTRMRFEATVRFSCHGCACFDLGRSCSYSCSNPSPSCHGGARKDGRTGVWVKEG